jgi:hypothetical protein
MCKGEVGLQNSKDRILTHLGVASRVATPFLPEDRSHDRESPFTLWVAKTSSAARLLAFHGSVKAGVDGGLGPYCGVECRLRAEEST